jgi:hypothetical protein
MDDQETLQRLIELADQLGIEVRRGPAMGDSTHPGGAVVRLRGREILMIDPSASVEDRIAAAAAALRGREALAEMFLPPVLRELIDGD